MQNQITPDDEDETGTKPYSTPTQAGNGFSDKPPPGNESIYIDTPGANVPVSDTKMVQNPDGTWSAKSINSSSGGSQIATAGAGSGAGVNNQPGVFGINSNSTLGNINGKIGQIQGEQQQQMQGASIDTGQSDQVRAQQDQLSQMLFRQAMGYGPSLAQSQFQQATQAGLHQQLAMAASARGINPALAARNAALGQASINQNAAMQSGQLRAQEQLAAFGQLGGALQGQRAQDIGLATSQAGLTEQTQTQNMQASVEQQRIKDSLVQQYVAMGLSAQLAQQAADLDMAKFQQSDATQRYGIDKNVAVANNAQNAQYVGAGLSAAGTIVGAGIGTMAGPAGTAVGAAGGNAAGTAAAKAVNQGGG